MHHVEHSQNEARAASACLNTPVVHQQFQGASQVRVSHSHLTDGSMYRCVTSCWSAALVIFAVADARALPPPCTLQHGCTTLRPG